MHGVVDCRREVLTSEARQRYLELHAQLKGSQDNLRSAAYNLSSLQQQQRTVRHHFRLGNTPHRYGLGLRPPENQGRLSQSVQIIRLMLQGMTMIGMYPIIFLFEIHLKH